MMPSHRRLSSISFLRERPVCARGGAGKATAGWAGRATVTTGSLRRRRGLSGDGLIGLMGKTTALAMDALLVNGTRSHGPESGERPGKGGLGVAENAARRLDAEVPRCDEDWKD